MPMQREKYPDNWEWLSKQVIKDAGDKCELCFAPNGKLVVRDPEGEHPWTNSDKVDAMLFSQKIGDGGYTLIKIVLTVHHINCNKMDSRKQNLIALCQRCHLRLDLLRHMENRNKNKNKNKEQTKLFNNL